MTSDHLRRVKRAPASTFHLLRPEVERYFTRRLAEMCEQNSILSLALDRVVARARFLRRYPYGSQAKGQPRRAAGYIA